MEYFGSFLGCFEFRYIVAWGRGREGIVHSPPFLFNPLTTVEAHATSLEESREGKARKKMSIRNIEGGSSLFRPDDKFRAGSLPRLSTVEF